MRTPRGSIRSSAEIRRCVQPKTLAPAGEAVCARRPQPFPLLCLRRHFERHRDAVALNHVPVSVFQTSLGRLLPAAAAIPRIRGSFVAIAGASVRWL